MIPALLVIVMQPGAGRIRMLDEESGQIFSQLLKADKGWHVRWASCKGGCLF